MATQFNEEAIKKRMCTAPFKAFLSAQGNMTRQRGEARKRTPELDHARFTAGIIDLYEAVLTERVPQRMLRLIEEIQNQERKY